MSAESYFLATKLATKKTLVTIRRPKKEAVFRRKVSLGWNWPILDLHKMLGKKFKILSQMEV